MSGSSPPQVEPSSTSGLRTQQLLSQQQQERRAYHYYATRSPSTGDSSLSLLPLSERARKRVVTTKASMGTAKWKRSTRKGELCGLENIPAGKTKKKKKQPLEMGAHKKQAENAHVQPSCLLTTAFAKIVWYSRVPPPCASSTAPRVLLPLPTSRGCASWDSSRRNRGLFIRQERARRILFAQVFANCRPPPSQGLSPMPPLSTGRWRRFKLL